MNISIVGTGIAGLSAAWWLRAAGHRVVLFEKHYKPGGRLNSRRKAGLVMDHGQRYFKRDDPTIRKLLQACGLHSELRPIDLPIYNLNSEGQRIEKSAEEATDKNRVTIGDGLLTLPTLLRRQMAGFNSIGVTDVEWVADGRHFLIHTEPPLKKEETLADAVIVACPAHQAMQITRNIKEFLNPEFVEKAATVQYTRTFTLMAAIRDFQPSGGFFALRVEGAQNSAIEWLSFENLKCTERNHPIFSSLVVHATADASMKLWKMDDMKALKQLYAAAEEYVTDLPEKWHWASVKRWDISRLKDPRAIVGVKQYPATADGGLPIEFCGDYRAGDGLEHAARSGKEAAQALMDKISVS